MKKILSILLVAGMILSIAACSKDDSENGKKAASDTFKNINTDAPEIEGPDAYSAKEDKKDSKKDKEEETSSGSSAFSNIATDVPDIKAPESVKVSDAEFNFEVTAPEIDAVTPVKPSKAEFDFEVKDFDLNLSANLTEYELGEIADMSIEEKEYILERKADLLTALAASFAKINLNVTINEISGEIIMDSSVLFANDDATVSAEGKELVKKFIKAYASVVCDDEYKDFISQIIVEGHTDTNGSYDYNMKLSEKRAANVEKICLSDEADVSDSVMKTLKEKLRSSGCSYDRPVKNPDGSVNMDASRRVAFRFLINLGD